MGLFAPLPHSSAVQTKPILKRVIAFIEYSNSMDDIYENIDEENPNKKCKMLIPFDDMIPDMLCNKKIHPIVIEVLYRV